MLCSDSSDMMQLASSHSRGIWALQPGCSSPTFLSFLFCPYPLALGRISGSPSHTHLRLQTKPNDAMRFSDVIFPLSLAITTVSAGVVNRRAAFTLQNGLDAQGLNRKFQSLTPDSSCTDGENACVNGQLGQCVGGKFVLFSCSAPLQCIALPLVNKPGTRAGLLGKREIEEREAIWSRAEKAPPACKAKAKAKRADTTAAGASLLLKRIAQTDLGQVAQSWQDLCVKSGGKRNGAGGDPCVKLAGQNGIAALLANADPCAQQDNADAMVDFAKSPGVKNEQALIANAIAYRKHPRNALNIDGVVPSTFSGGVVNAQLQGVDPGLFGSPNTGLVAFGAREFYLFSSLMK
ncbi:hypothetical protein EDB85DRAFT_2009654 [Lactarius pseudohatsudake]|nr:hypothetical protein EDB85DRAFT_2009654 [Lactarius pseudohatsudake]